MNTKTLNAKGVFALLKETYTEFSKDACMRLAAALAYYSVFSAAPLILIAIGIVGAIYGQDAAQGKVAEQLSQVVGPQVADAVQQLVANAGKNSRGGIIIGTITLLVGASGVFAQLKDSLNTIWEVKPKPDQGIWGFVRTRLLSFGMVLVIGFIMLVSLVATTLLTAFNDRLEQMLGLPPVVSGLLAYGVPLAIEVLLFAMIFKFLPDAKILWKNVWVGAAVTAVLFEIGKALLSWYLGQASTTSSFGAAGSLVLLLLWVHYTSLILFFGAEFTEVYARASGHVIQPKEHAMKVTPAERAEQGMEPDVVPHPSAAAEMAGRDPNTGVGSGGSTAGGEGHGANQPRKESLEAVLGEPLVEEDVELPPRFRTDAPNRPVRRVHPRNEPQNPMVEIGAALGFGLLMGFISRMTDHRARHMSAKEHLRLGARAAVAAGAAALASAGPKAAKAADPEVAKRAAANVASRVRGLREDLPKRVEQVLRK